MGGGETAPLRGPNGTPGTVQASERSSSVLVLELQLCKLLVENCGGNVKTQTKCDLRIRKNYCFF